MEGSPPPGGFLPPDPGGREPDLGSRPQSPAAPTPPAQHQEADYAPPAHAQWGTPQPQPAPGADNGPAVLGFSLSLSSLALLVVTVGLSSLVSVGLAIAGMVHSRKGQGRVREGLTQKNEGLANAGWVIGIVGLVFASLASIVWILAGIGLATDEDLRRDFERELDRELDRSRSGVALLAAARLAGAALL